MRQHASKIFRLKEPEKIAFVSGISLDMVNSQLVRTTAELGTSRDDTGSAGLAGFCRKAPKATPTSSLRAPGWQNQMAELPKDTGVDALPIDEFLFQLSP
jgi:hypothetical protein